jgi:hypothetical protein
MSRRSRTIAAATALAVLPVAAACTPEELRAWQAATAAQIDPVWDRLAECESGGRWSLDGRYDGGLQFHPDTWRANGGSAFAAYAHQATREQQITVAQRLRDRAGWGQWPHCSRQLGLR